MKELHYFNRFAYTPFDGDAIREYHRRFPRPVDHIAGEWTPRYMYDFWTPPLLARAAPRAKMLVLLRDPIERFRSGFSRGATSAKKPKQAALVRLANDQLRRSLYFEQLTTLLEHFDRAQLLVLQYERCLEDTISQLHRTYEFLGLDPGDHVPASIHERVGRKRPSMALSEDLIRTLKHRLADDVTQLARAFPEIDLTLWPHFRPAER
jgi:Sulfotransferase domain